MGISSTTCIRPLAILHVAACMLFRTDAILTVARAYFLLLLFPFPRVQSMRMRGCNSLTV